MKVLITGSSGFVGKHLGIYLKSKDYEIINTDIVDSDINQENFNYMDVTNTKNTSKVINENKPDSIIHLAGFSSVGKSFENPELCKRINVDGTKNILNAVIENNIKTKILIISSAEVYGIQKLFPIKETQKLNSLSPYSQSRILQEELCLSYIEKFDLDIVISRSFNHTGPGQPPIFVIPSFAKQIVSIENGNQDTLKVGNLDAIRDFSDVRDIVEAYYLAITRGKTGEIYNICSGTSYSIENLLKMLINLSKNEIIIKQDPSKHRASDIPKLEGDCSKFRKETGWSPKYSIRTTLSDVINYWRDLQNQVKK